MRCEWYSFFVKNEGKNANVTGKGNYCENRWWLWILMILGALFLIGLFIGVICYCCCNKKKEKVIEQEPLVIRKQNVFVQKARPVEHHYVHQEPVVYYQSHHSHQSRQPVEVRTSRGPHHETTNTVTNQYNSYAGEGERVLVETRTYSPDREAEAKVEYHGHQDWARYSQANWKNHN